MIRRPIRPQAAIFANAENVLGTWHSVLTMEIIEEDCSLHHREWVDGSEYSGRGFDRTMEPELCRYRFCKFDAGPDAPLHRRAAEILRFTGVFRDRSRLHHYRWPFGSGCATRCPGWRDNRF